MISNYFSVLSSANPNNIKEQYDVLILSISLSVDDDGWKTEVKKNERKEQDKIISFLASKIVVEYLKDLYICLPFKRFEIKEKKVMGY